MDEEIEQMFVVKEFKVEYRQIGDAAQLMPTMHMVTLQILSEVGASDNLMASPLMYLNEQQAQRLSRELLRQAQAALHQSSTTAPDHRQ